MNKKEQITAVTMVISELCNLIRAIEEPEYTEKQASEYYDQIFAIHRLKRK